MLTSVCQPSGVRGGLDRWCTLLAILLIFAVAVFHLLYLALWCQLDLAPDEAHYWDWSRHLDWSYYSKGPLVAWLIWLSCSLFGSLAEQLPGGLMVAVRLPAVLCGALLLASLYVLTRETLGRPQLALAVVFFGLSLPVVTAGSLLMTIDAPYTACWGWALVFAHRAVTGRGKWAWEITGFLVGVGILAKYTMVLFLPSLVLFLLFSPSHRRLLLSGGFARMLGIVVVCCLPIVIWNANNGWVTLWHVLRLAGLQVAGEESLHGGKGIHWLGPLAYLGGQAALLLGYWFVLWGLAMLCWNPWRCSDSNRQFLWWMSAPMFLVFFAFSFKTGGGELNWPVTAYLSGCVLGSGWLAEQLQASTGWYRRTTLACLGTATACGFLLTAAVHHSQLLHPLMEYLTGPPTADRPYPVRSLDPTCRLRGWRYLGRELDSLREQLRQQDGVEPVLAGTNWSLPGALGIYCSGYPTVYSLGRAQGDRYSQYDFWPGPTHQAEAFRGRTFVVVGQLSASTMKAFDQVEPSRQVVYFQGGRPLAGWQVTVCKGFRGFQELPRASH